MGQVGEAPLRVFYASAAWGAQGRPDWQTGETAFLTNAFAECPGVAMGILVESQALQQTIRMKGLPFR
jgi:hypothetical protein